MTIKAEVSIGEFLDKMTILEIKCARIRDEAKLANVRKELDVLRATWSGSPYAVADTQKDYAELKAVNEELWLIEDRIRQKESSGSFDEEFIDLARSVYHCNDKRSAIKKRINLQLESGLVEEKFYPGYSPREP